MLEKINAMKETVIRKLAWLRGNLKEEIAATEHEQKQYEVVRIEEFEKLKGINQDLYPKEHEEQLRRVKDLDLKIQMCKENIAQRQIIQVENGWGEDHA